MNWLDIIIALIVGLTTVVGFRQGFLRKILGIAGIIGGFILAIQFYKDVGGFLQKLFSLSNAEAFIIAFIMIVLVIFSAAVWVSRFFTDKNSTLSTINKILGAGFGLLQGVILASVVLSNLALINIPNETIRNSSLLYKMVYPVAPKILDLTISHSETLKGLYNEYLSTPNKTNGKDSHN